MNLSPLELREFADRMEFQQLTKAEQAKVLVDRLLEDVRIRLNHGGLVAPAFVRELEAIRALLG